MAKTNTKPKVAKVTKVTHEKAIAQNINARQELIRSVLACLLWEDSFYESGDSIADRINKLVKQVGTKDVMDIARIAKHDMKIRHAPLQVTVNAIAKRDGLVTANDVMSVINRPDDMTELLSLYWKANGKDKPLAAVLKKGLAKAFTTFDKYQLSKYQNKGDIKLRDVMFLTHPKPLEGMEETYKALANKTLEAPDTWEVNLSAGSNKKETFERLIKEGKLGALALLRNLRNMRESRISSTVIRNALATANYSKILPYQFIAAANHNTDLEDAIESAMFSTLSKFKKFAGRTVILVDNSGSMYGPKISAKSELQRIDAACGLAVLARELCEEAIIYSFSDDPHKIAPRRGFALREAIKKVGSGGTDIGKAVNQALSGKPDRIILITDEQSHTPVPTKLSCKGYCLNVASYQNGVAYNGNWVNITGFSENIFRYIEEYETSRV